MRFQLLAFSLLAWTAAAASLQRRDPVPLSTMVADIQGIDEAVNALIAFLKSYNGGAIGKSPIGTAITAIDTAYHKAFVDTTLRATPFNVVEIGTMFKVVAHTIQRDIPELNATLFKTYGHLQSQKSVVLAGLKLLEYDHTTFTDILMSKVIYDLLNRDGRQIFNKMDYALQDAIELYSSRA